MTSRQSRGAPNLQSPIASCSQSQMPLRNRQPRPGDKPFGLKNHTEFDFHCKQNLKDLSKPLLQVFAGMEALLRLFSCKRHSEIYHHRLKSKNETLQTQRQTAAPSTATVDNAMLERTSKTLSIRVILRPVNIFEKMASMVEVEYMMIVFPLTSGIAKPMVCCRVAFTKTAQTSCHYLQGLLHNSSSKVVWPEDPETIFVSAISTCKRTDTVRGPQGELYT